VNGLTNARLAQTETAIPGIEATVVLAEFTLPASSKQKAVPFEWRVQDVGAPQFQLEVSALDALLERTTRAGYRFVSVRREARFNVRSDGSCSRSTPTAFSWSSSSERRARRDAGNEEHMHRLCSMMIVALLAAGGLERRRSTRDGGDRQLAPREDLTHLQDLP
jgi:hypothetical protein